MKKIFLLTVITLFAFSGVFAQIGFNPGKKRVVGKVSQKQHYAPQSKFNILSENFEGGVLPTGWSKIDGDCGWLFGTDGSSQYFTIPAHTTYAYVNDDACGVVGDMVDVWLITPSMNFSAVTNAILGFESASERDFLTIKASVDGGTTWVNVKTIENNHAEWSFEQISLASFNGEADVKIAFHYNDGGEWSYGWAIDDVLIYLPEANDLSVVGATPIMEIVGNSVYPTVTVKNMGAEILGSFDINVVINDGTTDVYTSTLNVTNASLAMLDQIVYTMPDEWIDIPDGSFTITATVAIPEDAVAVNNIYTNTFDSFVGIKAKAATLGLSGVYYLGTPEFYANYESDILVMGGCTIDGKFYAVDRDTENIGYFNESMDTWTVVGPHGVTGQEFVVSMAYDAVNDKLYSIGLSGTYPDYAISLIEIDYTTGAGTVVATSPQTGTLIAIAASTSGQFYGVMHSEIGNGKFYSINPTTAAFTLIGDMGEPVSGYYQAMTFDASTNICYLQAYDNFGGLSGTYSIDLATGVPTLVGVHANLIITAMSICNNLPSCDDAITTLPYINTFGVADPCWTIEQYNVNRTWHHDAVQEAYVCFYDLNLLDQDEWLISPEFDLSAYSSSNLNVKFNWKASYYSSVDPFDNYDMFLKVTTDGGTTWTSIWSETDEGVFEGYVYRLTTVDVSAYAGQSSVQFTFNYVGNDGNSWYVNDFALEVESSACPTITTLPYINTFDVADPCWTINQNNATQTWLHNGDGKYVCLSDPNMLDQDEWLVSPEFDLSAYSANSLNVIFSWIAEYEYSVSPDDNYDMLLKVTTDGGTTWTSIWDETVQGVFETETEQFSIVDISSYAGLSSVKFAFNYVGNDGAAWTVEDFSLEIVSGVRVENSNIISIYPNPSNGFVNISVTENSIVSVIDLAGRTISTYNVNANQELSFTQSAGMCIVKVESNGKVSTHKLIIE